MKCVNATVIGRTAKSRSFALNPRCICDGPPAQLLRYPTWELPKPAQWPLEDQHGALPLVFIYKWASGKREVMSSDRLRVESINNSFALSEKMKDLYNLRAFTTLLRRTGPGRLVLVGHTFLQVGVSMKGVRHWKHQIINFIFPILYFTGGLLCSTDVALKLGAIGRSLSAFGGELHDDSKKMLF
ncbi:hypothetical protein B0H66DRAFT_34819 [Apodospora peruviana]|uniref:Uncharacterized protein n=1 Tax=Apodospora peruviana TaxID=516989 RepID=A0AAE0IR53_9PEZI|nr:hypothetical protein B0H66DRAFT_34819 [Apodospora peruviana]